MSTGRRVTIKANVAPYYYQGEDAYPTFEHYVAGALTDATAAPTITVEDSVGQLVVDAQNTTKDTTGKYYYEYAIAAAAACGVYKYQLSAAYDSITHLGCKGTFEVKESL